MSYTPIYTTVESITRKLRNRLNVTQGGFEIYATENLAVTEVDENLVNEVIEENEAFVNQYLSLIYVLPLQNNHPILKKCVDSLVISDLLRVHSFSNSENMDTSSFGGTLRQDGLQILRSLTYDLNVAIPGLHQETKDRVTTQALILQGEKIKSTENAQLPVSSSIKMFTYVDSEEYDKYDFEPTWRDYDYNIYPF